MASNTHTPLTFWLSLPLQELRRWVEANNNLLHEEK